MSYVSGVMTCRSSVDGIPLGEKLSILSTGDFEKVDEHNFDVSQFSVRYEYILFGAPDQGQTLDVYPRSDD